MQKKNCEVCVDKGMSRSALGSGQMKNTEKQNVKDWEEVARMSVHREQPETWKHMKYIQM